MWNIVVLGLASFLTDVSSEMVYPLVPLFLVGQLGASPAVVGLIEGIAESLASLMKVYAGHRSDVQGRRKPLAIFGYAWSSLGKVAIYLAAGWPVVLLGRIVDRFGKGIRTAPRDALISESVAEGRRGAAFGLHRAMDTAGAVAGIGLAIFFTRVYRGDIRPILLWSLIPAFLGVLAVGLARETGAGAVVRRPRVSLADWKALPTQLRAFLLVTLVYSLLSYPAGRISDRIGRRRVLVMGYAFYGLVYLGFGFATGGRLMWLLFGAYGIYSALTQGVERALITDLCPADRRATFIGLHATLVGIGLLPASLLAGFLWNSVSPSAAFIVGGTLGLAASVAMAAALKGLSHSEASV